MELKRELKVLSKNIGGGERHHLGGKCSYKRVFDYFIHDAILCNKITEIDPEIFYNQETGFYSYDEYYNDKLEELKEEYKKELEEGTKTLEELEQEAECYADEEQYNYEFYQYFIIDLNHYDVNYLKKLNQHTLQIMWSEVLECYILGVGHWGTGWDYVGSDFDLIEIKEEV